MTEPTSPHYRWSDAWLLLATDLASREAPAPLSAIVAAGDGIQHAVFTHAELDGGLARLLAGGLVEQTAGRFALTARGHECLRVARGGTEPALRAQQDALERLLGAAPWSAADAPRAAADAAGAAVVSAEAYRQAVQHYG